MIHLCILNKENFKYIYLHNMQLIFFHSDYFLAKLIENNMQFIFISFSKCSALLHARILCKGHRYELIFKSTFYRDEEMYSQANLTQKIYEFLNIFWYFKFFHACRNLVLEKAILI